MKKVLALLIGLFTISLMVSADDDRPISFDQLPTQAQTFVKQYFSEEKVALAKVEREFLVKKYEVIFASSIKVEFYKDGTWKEVDCKYATVPDAVVPSAILQYVKATYPDQRITKIEKEDRGGYEAKLASGLSLEFDKRFNLIDLDH